MVDFVARVLHVVDHGAPVAEIARPGFQFELAQDDLVHALGGEDERNLVDRLDVARGDDGRRVDVAEEADLLLHLRADETLAAAQQDVGLNAERAQFLDAVLGGLGLELLRGGDPGDQRDMHEDAVLTALLVADLANGFEEGSDSMSPTVPPISHDHHVHAVDHFAHAGLDFVGDVRDHLHGLAEVIAAAFALDDLLVDAAGGQVVGAG